MNTQLTPWFSGHVKPARAGVYQLLCGHQKNIGYQRWNGKHWFTWSDTEDGAAKSIRVASTQNDKWRGLTKESK